MNKPIAVYRRSFLKASTAAAAGLTLRELAKAHAESRPGRVLGANDRINWGFIGVGGMGRGQLDAVVKMEEKENVKVLAVADVWQKRIDRAAAHCKGDGYMDWRKIIDRKDIHAVLVATPDHWHSTQAIEAMKAGKHVYLQKPMTLTVEQALEVRDVQHQTGMVLQVGSQAVADDACWKAHDAIKAGLIGKVLLSQAGYSRNNPAGEWNWPIDPEAGPKGTGQNRIDWDAWLGHKEGRAPHRDWEKEHGAERYFRFRKFWDYNGGVATDLLYHKLGPLLVAIAGPNGEYPSRVTANGGKWFTTDVREVPDTFVMTIDYPSKHTITLTSCMCNDTDVEERICGNEATLYFQDDVVIRAQGPYKKQWSKDKGNGKDEIRIKAEPRRGHEENFIDAVRGKSPVWLNADLGAAIMVAIKLGVESYRQSKVMLFDENTGKVTTA